MVNKHLSLENLAPYDEILQDHTGIRFTGALTQKENPSDELAHLASTAIAKRANPNGAVWLMLQ
jgi:hypothetical protein